MDCSSLRHPAFASVASVEAAFVVAAVVAAAAVVVAAAVAVLKQLLTAAYFGQ